MIVLVLNGGSSSVKAAAFALAAGTVPAREPAWSATIRWDSVPASATLAWRRATVDAALGDETVALGTAPDAIAAIVRCYRRTGCGQPDAIGHRVVHGLDLERCTAIDAGVRTVIERAAELAPLHNEIALAGIDVAREAFPGVPQYADFDTAFHRTLPPAAAAFAGPYAWFATDGWRRYGFHGISHRYNAGFTADLLGADPATLRLVSAHLGGGASLAAVAGGRSIDTTMGFTPLDGLVMGTRAGSIDPGLLLHLLRTQRYDVAALERVLNHESGLRGLSGISDDLRAVHAGAERNDPRARLALDVYVHRLASSIAAMAASLGGIDALSFTGGVGEHAVALRESVCRKLAFLGIRLDPAAPADAADREIGAADARVRVTVVTAREEFAIARDVLALVDSPTAAASH